MSGGSIELRKRVIVVGVPIAIVATVLGAYMTSRAVAREFDRTIETNLLETADRAARTVEAYMTERLSDMRDLATLPAVIAATGTGGDMAERLRLDRLTTTALEERFAETSGLVPDPRLQSYFTQFADSGDFSEITVTEKRGFTVLRTNPGSQFVRSGEQWWERLIEAGDYQSPPTYDQSSGRVQLILARAIADPQSGDLVGTVQSILDLSGLTRLLGADSKTVGSSVQVVDSSGKVVISTDAAVAFGSVIQSTAIVSDQIQVARTASVTGIVVSAPVGTNPWSVVVERRREVALAAARSVRDAIYLTAGAGLIVAIILIAWLTDWLSRRVTRPIRLAGIVAGRVADGDLSISPQASGAGSEEVNKLLESIHEMVGALQRLVGEIRSSSHESAAMAQQISASTEEMSASTQQMADTCQDLSEQATVQADLARRSADDANRILSISSTLADGSNVAAERSTAINRTADEHREHLIEGSAKLAQLASDLERGAADAEKLAELSEHVQRFVTQAKATAAQTNMLALNAAIEASRASHGEERGFAVVADEVRKLASQAAQAATDTSQIVHKVQGTVQDIRERLTRLAEASSAVREVAEAAARALEEVAGATAESSAWSDEISHAAGDVKKLVEEITGRLESIALGTESIVAASQQIAASAEEQSASTEEIAGSAAQLASVSDHLTLTVNSFRL